MADAGGSPPERGHLPKYTPSYDAPTTPIPRIRDKSPHDSPGDADDNDDTVPRRWPAGMGVVPRGFPTGDGEERLLVRRREPIGEPGREPNGAFPDTVRVPPAPQEAPVPPRGALPVPVPPVPPARGDSVTGPAVRKAAPWTERLVNGIGDIPLRLLYTVGAVLATAGTVVLIFLLFSGDEPQDQVEVDRAQAEVSAGPQAVVSPSVPPVTLPPVPKARPLPVFQGQAAVIVGGIVDSKAGIGYAKLAEPWRQRQSSAFSVAQRIGGAAVPTTLIASRPLPGKAPVELSGEADYRRVAASAVRWAVRTQHPQGSKVTWTASVPTATGGGWILGFRVRYEVDGATHTSQAAVAVVDTGEARPAMLLISIPDSRKDRWSDISTVLAGIRPL